MASLSNGTQRGSESIKVVVRIRPLSIQEKNEGHKIVTVANEERACIEIRNPSFPTAVESLKTFTFDAVFSDKVTQRTVYDVCAAPVVESVLMGYNGTIFVYGQTGSGKTHTMEGIAYDVGLRGIIPNAFQHIFDHVALNQSSDRYLVRASYFEIYNEEVHDLISETPKMCLTLKETMESGVYVKDLTTVVVKSFEEIFAVLRSGKKNRVVGATCMNQTSSRSHSIFTIVIERSSVDAKGDEHIRVGKLNLVDLAGSERQSKTGATGDRLKEASKINLSLSSLGNVIAALVDGKSQHIPYRDSKLTRILQDSLGGNTKTVMCANAGPADFNYDETLSTLRYANRAKNIKNQPIINEDPKDTMLREYQDEIKRLKEQLLALQLQDDRLPQSDKNTIRKRQEDDEISIVPHEGNKNTSVGNVSTNSNDHLRLEAMLEEEGKYRAEVENQRNDLLKKLKEMEAQLVVGGDMIGVTVKHEAALRRAEQELIAKKESELILSRRMAEQEEVNLLLEEKYHTLNEEVHSKTKKLKRLWTKYQQAKCEIQDLLKEFQTERDDYLDAIRQLTKQLKLRELVIDNFIPKKFAAMLDEVNNGGLAVWREDEEYWYIPKLELAGNNHLRTKYPHPETEYARRRRKEDISARLRQENLINLEVCVPERSTQSYDRNLKDCKISNLLEMDIDDELEKVAFRT